MTNFPSHAQIQDQLVPILCSNHLANRALAITTHSSINWNSLFLRYVKLCYMTHLGNILASETQMVSSLVPLGRNIGTFVD